MQFIKKGEDPKRKPSYWPSVENIYIIKESNLEVYCSMILKRINRLEAEKRNFIQEIKNFNHLIERM